MSEAVAGLLRQGAFLNAGSLYLLAWDACQRLKPVEDQLADSHRDALVAVLFSAATLEAFVSDFSFMARTLGGVHSIPALKSVAALLDEAEDGHASVRLKYLLAKFLVTGEPYNKGAAPFQDFDLLIRLRDAIVHLKTEEFSPESDAPPKRLFQNCNRVARALLA